jgi:hypothetical protein
MEGPYIYNIKYVLKRTYVLLLPSEFPELLNEERRTEIYKGNKRYTFIAVFPELTQPVTQIMYIAADCCSHRHNYFDVERLTAEQLYCTNTVQFVQCAPELYLQ